MHNALAPCTRSSAPSTCDLPLGLPLTVEQPKLEESLELALPESHDSLRRCLSTQPLHSLSDALMCHLHCNACFIMHHHSNGLSQTPRHDVGAEVVQRDEHLRLSQGQGAVAGTAWLIVHSSLLRKARSAKRSCLSQLTTA